ncbi:RtcB family protein [Egibacter rhizosphaerae]|uniref:tRNA-splicing ligase RtcB n=1 Tax=Egibacter rhizosphaerae TaxID=1670831 RepID=A0A411YIE8_9ACTN|nr:RtcB family protein [Egibacter rhizosphaerae]QBI20921.1 RtcB family protein [Egibacter rhizosphaerae]
MPQPAATEPIVELPASEGMHVSGIVFASRELLGDEPGDVFDQVRAVATLPGIVEASYAMPDAHVGYGFPIGGVAATDITEGGVVSPGGVGFDISCGVRLMAAPVALGELHGDQLGRLLDALAALVPHGTGPGGLWKLQRRDLKRLLVEGAELTVAEGHGTEADLARIEDGGRLEGARADVVGKRALERGQSQLGSLGGGNHFLEVQVVDEVIDPERAAAFGLGEDQVVATVHCGSRGLGHQVCSDAIKQLQPAMDRAGITVPDPQLACAPVDSPEGRDYLAGMAAAANFARANRQLIGEAIRDAFEDVLGTRDVRLVYDVNHNMAARERHTVDGRDRELCVHRKGATLALPADSPQLPDDLRPHGQPVIVPGSMGTSSWVLAGDTGRAFASTCHGAGRQRSRAQARKRIHGNTLRDQLTGQGLEVRAKSAAGLAEEAPDAYKDVDEVVRVCEQVGLSRRVARLRPLGVVKG